MSLLGFVTLNHDLLRESGFGCQPIKGPLLGEAGMISSDVILLKP